MGEGKSWKVKFDEVKGLLSRYMNTVNCLAGDMVMEDPESIYSDSFHRKAVQRDLLDKIIRQVEIIEETA